MSFGGGQKTSTKSLSLKWSFFGQCLSPKRKKQTHPRQQTFWGRCLADLFLRYQKWVACLYEQRSEVEPVLFQSPRYFSLVFGCVLGFCVWACVPAYCEQVKRALATLCMSHVILNASIHPGDNILALTDEPSWGSYFSALGDPLWRAAEGYIISVFMKFRVSAASTLGNLFMVKYVLPIKRDAWPPQQCRFCFFIEV